MKSQEKRDEQTVAIAAALPVLVIVGAAGWAAWAAVDVLGASAVVLLLGVALAAIGLARRRSR